MVVKLIVGLGNPGPKYTLTRHNIGFMSVDAFAQAHSLGAFRSEHKAEVCKGSFQGQPILLVKPQTFMNLSGESVMAIKEYYKVDLQDILVVHDDIDQPFSSLKIQKSRGHGGHNGIRNIHQVLGTDEYARLKLGVGRPSHPGHDVADYVLSGFSKDEMSQLTAFLDRAIDAIESFIDLGADKAANLHNKK